MAKYKKGDKFIVEIDKVNSNTIYPITADNIVLDDNKAKHDLYSLSGIHDSVLSEEDLDKLECYEERYSAASFNEGIKFAEDVYKKVHALSGFEIRDIFNIDGGTAWAVIQKYTVTEIDSRLNDYNFGKVNVYDQFITIDESGNKHYLIITSIDLKSGYISYLYRDGRTGFANNFDTLKKILYKRVSLEEAEISALDFVLTDKRR